MQDEDGIRAIYGALDRCLQYGADPLGWRSQLCSDLADLFVARVTLCGEVHAIWDDDHAMVSHMVDYGWPSEDAKSHFVRYQLDGANRYDPMRQALASLQSDVVVAACSELLDVDVYRSSDVYSEYMSKAGIGDILTAITAIGDAKGDRWNLATCMRAKDAEPFSRSEVERFGVVASELRFLVGDRLADAASPVNGLTLRQRQALEALLTGASEPECAKAVGVKPSTFHGYVRSVYRAFNVSSRAELQSLFYGRGRLWDGGMTGDPRQSRLRREPMPMTKRWRGRRTFL